MTTVIYFDATPKGMVCCIKVNGTPKGPLFRSITEVLVESGLPSGLVTKTTNQRAEYVALIAALGLVDNYSKHILIGDCENVILQMTGENKTKSGPMLTLNLKARDIINTRALDIEFRHVQRDYNQAGVLLDRYMKIRG